MKPTIIESLRTLLASPDHPDRDALFVVLADRYVTTFAVLPNRYATTILGCLAPQGSLLQIATALGLGWAWCFDGWDRQSDELVEIITDQRCPFPEQMIETWSCIPSAVGVLRDRTDTLVAWAEQRIHPEWYDDLAILLGPSDESLRLLMRYPSSYNIERTLRRWSMSTDPNNQTAWQAMIDTILREPLRRGTHPSWAAPTCEWDDAVNSIVVLSETVNDIIDGWSPDHPSIRGRFAWVENHVGSNLDIGRLALVASIGRSDALADAVCDRITHSPACVPTIAAHVPWSRLHSRIQTVIDETMRRLPNDRWKRTWACAIGQAPVRSNTAITPPILLWRIAPERWNDLDPSIRAALVSRINLPRHCYGWGVHPDLVGRWDLSYEKVFLFWNPDVLSDDLRAWRYADLLRAQTNPQHARVMVDLLMTLPPDRRARFEQIIEWRLGGRSEPIVQPPWEWTVWVALPAIDRQRRLRDWIAVLRGDRETSPAVRFWRARNDGLATLALMVGDVLGNTDPSPILAAILAQVFGLRENTTDVGPSLPFPDDLDAARRAQIERLPLDRNAQAYAAWCLRFLDQDMVLGSTLIALHPTIAVALAPFLSPAQQKAVAASPATQGWDGMTVMHWAAACENKNESTPTPIPRRIP